MGDHRANVKIEFVFHGKTYDVEMWINWFPDGDGIDSRVVDFFRSATQDGMSRYEQVMFEANREHREKQEREAELAELARLKEKYPDKQEWIECEL